MRVIMNLTLVPMGVGVSVSRYIAACEEIIEASGLTSELHANGTNIEGEWDDVMAVVKKCHERVHEMGAPRITTSMHLGTRTDKSQTMADKVGSVRSQMA